MKTLLPFILFFLSFSSHAQGFKTIAFYNVENLFDTIDDPEIDDSEFLPDGKNQWDNTRYERKISNIGFVISKLGMPDIIGLSEIENRKVLEDLVTSKSIAVARYQIIQFDSPDRRGVDVALLYNPRSFKPFFSENIRFTDPKNPDFLTRDILWVKGLFGNDTIHVAVNHWPSRRGGKEDGRLRAAEILRSKVDSVLSIDPKAKIVMMGDFNDDPTNTSIKTVLKANWKEKKLEEDGLYNTGGISFQNGFGSLYYRGNWNLFDQIIISQSLLKPDKGTLGYLPGTFTIGATPEMQILKGDDRGAPLRTFSYGVYNEDGFSDHFPVFIKLGTNE